jgi:hypothetical protein
VRCGPAHSPRNGGLTSHRVMSLQYFSLSSQQGDAESDLALSKWFLCGARKRIYSTGRTPHLPAQAPRDASR